MSEQLLNARQVAALLGLSPSTVLDKFEAGARGDPAGIPGFRIGGKVGSPVRFRESEVIEWIERGRCGPTPSQRPEIAL